MVKYGIRYGLALIFTFLSVVGGWAPADAQPLIGDEALRERIESDYIRRMDGVSSNRRAQFHSLLATDPLTQDELDGCRFLLAYCPLCDIVDCYDTGYFLRQVRGALRARDYFSWGRTVPEEIFLHFVLPHRVNNENLDESRDVFFEELRERIEGMSMYDAALEVNHWCHEKVEYRATDARTSAPLALVRTSWGRCGEESAFTVTALRAVGIPARQIYTPRWVHTDSNHAWVEVWIDGRWYYMGACEPEPELDMAWFTTPATRAMMMHTTVFGPYEGPEEVNERTEYYTTINLTAAYAPAREISVTVLDGEGRPAAGVKVKFRVYNYAEFYPLAIRTTDTDGTARVTTGYGDVLVWASHGDSYGYVKITPEADRATLRLDRNAGAEYVEDIIMDVPQAQPFTGAPSDKVAENRHRLAAEDSIRNAYMHTFTRWYGLTGALAVKMGVEEKRIADLLDKSQGNWQEILNFMESHAGNPYAVPLLESLTEKDLRDTPADYLDSYLNPVVLPAYEVPEELYVAKILSPRIDMELIMPWSSLFGARTGWLPVETTYGPAVRSRVSDPLIIVDEVKARVRPSLFEGQNYVACMITPRGVYETAMADRRSRNAFFVAYCRSAGIPAHIDRATGKPQFWKDGAWHDALLDDLEAATALPAIGSVMFGSAESNPVEPVYRSHYTLARFEEGDFVTLDLSGELAGRPYPAKVEVPAGYYRFMAGSRANDGSVAVHTEYFNLDDGGLAEIDVRLPGLTDKLFVEGILDMNTIIFLPDGTKTTLKDQSHDKGLVLLFVDPATEPTRHIVQEMPGFSSVLEEWGGGVLFVEPGRHAGATFNRSIFGRLPAQTVCMRDSDGSLLEAAAAALRMDFTDQYPLALYLNGSGGILFSHKGYRLGLVESIYKTITTELGTMPE